MKCWMLLPLSLAVAIPARLATDALASAPTFTSKLGAGASLTELTRAIGALERENDLLRERVATLRMLPTDVEPVQQRVSDDELAGAVARWRASHAPHASGVATGARPTGAAPTSAAATLPMARILEFFESRAAFSDEAQGMYEELRAANRMDELVAAVEALVATLAAKSPLGLARMKQLVNDGMEQPLATALRLEFALIEAHAGAADMAEGLAAFEAKRKPRFTGR